MVPVSTLAFGRRYRSVVNGTYNNGKKEGAKKRGEKSGQRKRGKGRGERKGKQDVLGRGYLRVDISTLLHTRFHNFTKL